MGIQVNVPIPEAVYAIIGDNGLAQKVFAAGAATYYFMEHGLIPEDTTDFQRGAIQITAAILDRVFPYGTPSQEGESWWENQMKAAADEADHEIRPRG